MKKRSTSMKRIVNALSNLNWGKRAYAVSVLCAATAITLPAQTFTTLHSFDGTDGYLPAAGLVQATNGDFYSTTTSGGTNGIGTVFKITPSGTLTTLYSFCNVDCTDGYFPAAGLVQATNGDFYGTTLNGGASSNCADGCGTIFKVTPSGTLTTLYRFDGTDGYFPAAGLVQATNGDFYGITTYGGANDNCEYGGVTVGCGTVFKITPSGTLTTLYSFCAQSGCTDGESPAAGLVQATNGDFYGTTGHGGAYGHGTVFKITPRGTLTTLYSFCTQSGCPDGAYPNGLVHATNGNFYGTTAGGGTSPFLPGAGTVFKITPGGTLTTLYNFCSQSGGVCPDGIDPLAALVQATDGDFYGTTYEGGANLSGTVFKITPSGTLATLYSFCAQSGCTDGIGPLAALVQDTNGDFYGTTYYGGAAGDGTVFRLSVGLCPFVKTRPHFGKVGAAVKILGTDLTGATSVSFNGTPVTSLTVNSSGSAISTTVPVGATTGFVTVTTPTGTLKSNVKFRVP
jgi:uncharacterized repeat protein (TIGR03803 family)